MNGLTQKAHSILRKIQEHNSALLKLHILLEEELNESGILDFVPTVAESRSIVPETTVKGIPGRGENRLILVMSTERILNKDPSLVASYRKGKWRYVKAHETLSSKESVESLTKMITSGNFEIRGELKDNARYYGYFLESGNK